MTEKQCPTPARTETNDSARRARAVAGVTAVILPMLPALPLLIAVRSIGVFPEYDYWTMLLRVVSADGVSRHLGDWFMRENESVVALPKLIYLVNMRLSGGDSRLLSAFALLMGAVCVWLYWTHLPRAATPLRSIVVRGMICGYVLTPLAAHNWFRGMSGVAWITANALVLGAISLVGIASRRCSWLALGGACVLMTVAPLTYISGVIGLVVVTLIAVMLPFTPRMKVVALAVPLLNLALHGLTYRRPGFHPEFATDPTEVARCALSLLGGRGLFSWSTSLLGGLVGLALVIVLVARAVFVSKQRVVEWGPAACLCVYPLALAAAAGVTRSGMGPEAYLTTKYGNIGGLFWAALTVVLVSQMPKRLRPIPKGLASAAVLMVVVSSGFWFDYADVRRFQDRAPFNRRGMLAVFMGVDDGEILRTVVYPSISVVDLRTTLAAVGHIPFVNSKTSEWGFGDSASPIDHPSLPEGRDRIEGRLLGIPEVVSDPRFRRTLGVVKCCDRWMTVEHVDRDGHVVGYAVGGFPTAGPVGLSTDDSAVCRFFGFVPVDVEEIESFVRCSWNDPWLPMTRR